MKNVLIATDKPFTPSAIQKISKIIHSAGYNLKLIEKYTSKQGLIDYNFDLKVATPKGGVEMNTPVF